MTCSWGSFALLGKVGLKSLGMFSVGLRFLSPSSFSAPSFWKGPSLYFSGFSLPLLRSASFRESSAVLLFFVAVCFLTGCSIVPPSESLVPYVTGNRAVAQRSQM